MCNGKKREVLPSSVVVAVWTRAAFRHQFVQTIAFKRGTFSANNAHSSVVQQTSACDWLVWVITGWQSASEREKWGEKGWNWVTFH